MNENAQAVQFMTETVGWGIVEEHIRNRIEAHKNSLLSCDIEDVSKHRAKVEALNGVLLYIQTTLQEGRETDE